MNETMTETTNGSFSHIRIRYSKTETCEELVLPETCTTINDYICDIGGDFVLPKRFIVPESNQYFRLVDNVLYNHDLTTIVLHPLMETAFEYEILDGVKKINEQAFQFQHFLLSVVIPDTVEYIDHCAFIECDKLTEIKLPASLIDLNHTAFYGCRSLESISISPNNQNFVIVDNVLYSKDMKCLLFYPNGKKNDEFIILEGVEIISFSAFENNKFLKSVKFPQSIKYIDMRAFVVCKMLYSAEIPNVSYSIGQVAFGNCDNLEHVTIGDKVDDIEIGAFSNCKKLSPKDVSTTLFDRMLASKKECKEKNLGKKIPAYSFSNTPVMRSLYKYRKSIGK